MAALFLTVTRPSPEGLITLGMGDRVVRAAPGEPTASVAAKHNLTKLEVVNNTLIRIRDNYVQPSRIDPKEMLYAALDSVQFNIPEVLVRPDRDADRVTIVVNDKTQQFSTADVDSPWRLSKKLKAIFRFVEAHMNPGADLAAVEYAAVNGMLGTLDPHSVLLDPDQSAEMEVSTGGEFGGLGIVIGMRDKKLTVIRPMEETPASRAGIEASDQIVRIDDEVTEHLTLQESVERMRGKPGSKVTLWVKRKEAKDLLRFDLVRDLIKVDSVEHKLLSKNVGYLKIRQFAGNTAAEVRQAMDVLEKQGARAWVLDLRWNPGGLLEQAIQVSDLFLDRGTIVTTVGGREREPRRASRKGADTKAPVAVLVNTGSASASEIVAGALKNLDRAVVIGSATFGKGSVQILYDNKDGSKLKLTIAQYLTPGDLSIQSLGIVPDIELHRMWVPDDNKEVSDFVRLLPPRRSYREKDLKSHLESEYAVAAPKPAAELSFVYQKSQHDDIPDDETIDPLELEEEEPVDDSFVEDFEIQLARDLVASVGKADREAFLRASGRVLDRRRTSEIKKLAGKLAKLGVDWSAPPSERPAPATLEARFEIAGHAGKVEAGETVELVGTVTNTGKTPAYRVHARVRADDRVFDETELVFGKVEPGETRSWTSRIKIPDAAVDRVDYLAFDVEDATGAQVASRPLKVRVEAAERPVFAYTHQLLDDGNGDGLIQPGEAHRLRVTVKNTGSGVAREAAAILRNASGIDVVLRRARFELGELAPGASKTVEFALKTAPRMNEKETVIELSVYDGVLGESVSEKLKYPVRAASAGPAKAGGAARLTRDAPIYEGASAESAKVASARRGTVLRVTGKQGSWYRVQLEKRRPGFVHASGVEETSGPPKLAGLQPLWQVTPPALAVELPSFESATGTYRLRGTAIDDTHVEDVYVFVSNRDAKVENRKVFYQSNRGGSQSGRMAFNADIPLWPGSNAVTVVARENDAVRSAHTVFLYRTKAGEAHAVAP